MAPAEPNWMLIAVGAMVLLGALAAVAVVLTVLFLRKSPERNGREDE